MSKLCHHNSLVSESLISRHMCIYIFLIFFEYLITGSIATELLIKETICYPFTSTFLSYCVLLVEFYFFGG